MEDDGQTHGGRLVPFVTASPSTHAPRPPLAGNRHGSARVRVAVPAQSGPESGCAGLRAEAGGLRLWCSVLQPGWALGNL